MAVARGYDATVTGPTRGKDSFPTAASRWCSLSVSVQSMLRLLLLLLAAFSVVSYSLLGANRVQIVLSGVSIRNWRSDFPSPHYDFRNDETHVRQTESTSNTTFLDLAAIDPNDDLDKQKFTMIMDGKVDEFQDTHSRWSYQRKMDHYIDLEQVRRRARPRHETWIVELQSPKLKPSWPRFRQLLQGWFRNKRHEPQVMQELLQTVKGPIDLFYSSKSNQSVEVGKRYKTCAVVGNSGILLEKNMGSFIDSHDMVMRLNNARVTGYESSVGSKTTIAFVNSNIYHSCSRRVKCFCHPYGEIPLVMYLCQIQHMMDVAFCEVNYEAPVLVTDPRLDNLCSRIIKWYSMKHHVEVVGKPLHSWSRAHGGLDFHYSSGLQAIVLALGICEKVDILGFGKSPAVRHHYHTNQKSELDLHDYAAEYLFYDDLRNKSSFIPFLSEAGITIPPVEIHR